MVRLADRGKAVREAAEGVKSGAHTWVISLVPPLTHSVDFSKFPNHTVAPLPPLQDGGAGGRAVPRVKNRSPPSCLLRPWRMQKLNRRWVSVPRNRVH